jgi:glycosyltransferase involved in cell wall biosynthesis
MKILFVQTNYPGFLNNFYSKTTNWQALSYQKLKNKWIERQFGTCNYYSKHLKPLGWQGEEVIINDWNLQSTWAKEHNIKVRKQNIPLTKFIPESIKNTMGLRNWIKHIFFKQVEYYKPDVIYIYDLSVLGVDDLIKLNKKVKLIVAQTATVLPINRKPLREYGLIISSFPHYVKRFRKMKINSEYLKWCVEDSIPKRIKKNKKAYNVVYVGGLTPAHRKGNKALEELTKEVGVDIWGYGENTLLPTSTIRKHFHGQAWGNKMYEIFTKSKIVVNRHIDVAENWANNMRMFEVTGMGALLITDHKRNIGKFFQVGKEVVTYKDPQDLVRKVKYYLSHPKERERIAKAGQKRTLKEHTYRERMKELDRILRKYI